MATASLIRDIQRYISNPLDPSSVGDGMFAGIIGDAPSHYSKSPALWNAAFNRLAIAAVYLPFDVNDGQVGDLLRALRGSQQFLGVNVTVPHKVRVLDFLDELDPGAARIQAVNTIVRTSQGKLVGYNTDGEGFIASILTRQPGQSESFLSTLTGRDVLLLGAGGSARAVAFHLSDHIGKGNLIISNRTLNHAAALAGEIQRLGDQAIAIDEVAIVDWAPKVGLIVNSTTKGQGGIRKLGNGMATMLAPYSALAPANPPALPENLGEPFEAQWREAATSDIEANKRKSETLAAAIPPATCFYDLIYHPEETVFLAHGRTTGHPTMNGKSMIVNQAAIAFCRRICQRQLQLLGKDTPETQRQVAEVMYASW